PIGALTPSGYFSHRFSGTPAADRGCHPRPLGPRRDVLRPRPAIIGPSTPDGCGVDGPGGTEKFGGGTSVDVRGPVRAHVGAALGPPDRQPHLHHHRFGTGTQKASRQGPGTG